MDSDSSLPPCKRGQVGTGLYRRSTAAMILLESVSANV